MNRIDPSGNIDTKTCLISDFACIKARSAETHENAVNARINNYYGITLTGSWSLRDRENLMGALDNLNSSLGGINQFTAGTTYSFSYNGNNYGGLTYRTGNIDFHGWGGSVPYQNYYHEVAHVIDFRSGGYFTDALSKNKVYASDGEFIMGGPKPYQRNSIGYANQQIIDPSGGAVDAQQHPGNAPCGTEWCISGNSTDEEWADLVANYVAGNFTNDKNGAARQTWVTNVWFDYFSPLGDRALFGR